MKLAVGLLFCILLNSSSAVRRVPSASADEFLAKMPCLDAESNAILSQCQEEYKATEKPAGCQSKSEAEQKACQTEIVNTITAGTNCVFQKAGAMDQSNNLSLETIKDYYTTHSNLTDDQKKAVKTTFDSCMASPPKFSLTPTQSMTAFKCITKSLVDNGCASSASG